MIKRDSRTKEGLKGEEFGCFPDSGEEGKNKLKKNTGTIGKPTGFADQKGGEKLYKKKRKKKGPEGH